MVSKKPGARDGRSVDLDLTARARALLEQDPGQSLAQEIAATGRATELIGILEQILNVTLARRDGRTFGAYKTCRHFRKDVRSEPSAPHCCALLGEPLSDEDSAQICLEQVPV
ncbi:MAG: hypothetical protein H7A21_10230 [Spirochaetales bacterium]|nr:hypothetical protein [Leptospiraceae bacterium]MCP5481800.1 hypothetical protein [Spirochaetales bacterium]MCP5486916.1 hypothetical protein [Spirochaetales bacterium]